MNHYAISQLINFVVFLFVAAVVYFHNSKSLINRTFALHNLAFGSWAICFYEMITSRNTVDALFWARILHFGAVFVPVFFLHFVYGLLNIKNKVILRTVYFVAFFICVFIPTKFFVGNANSAIGFKYFVGPAGIQYHFFTLFFFVVTTYSFVNLIKGYRKETTYRRNQILYFLVSLIIFYFFGSTAFLPLFDIPIPRFAFYGSTLYVGMITYAIITQNLMDIDLAWRYSLKNIIYFCIFVGSILGIIFGISNKNVLIATFFSSFLIFLSYFKSKIDMFLYNILIGKYKKLWDNLKNIGEIEGNAVDKLSVVDILVLDVSQALDLTYSAYYDMTRDTHRYEILKTTDSKYYNKKTKDILFESKLVAKLYKKRSFLYLESLMKDAKNEDLIRIFKDLKIELCFPLFDKDVLVGILVYGKKQSNAFFSKEDLKILDEIVEKAESQINNIYKLTHISEVLSTDILTKYKRMYHFQILEETKDLGQIRNLEDFAESSVKLINRLLHASEADIYLYYEDDREYVSQNPVHDDELEEENYLIKYLKETKDMVLASNLEKWAKETGAENFKQAYKTVKEMNASIVVPLIDISHLLGFLVIKNKNKEEQKYTQDDFLLLSFICDKVQTTLINIYANDKANIDFLTGLHNRKFLTYRLESEIIKTRREAKPISFLLMDIDEFKSFNDVGGHEEGDIVLEEVADALLDIVRPFDECFRYGGDEFAIILPNTTKNKAISFVNKFRFDLSQHKNIERLYKIFHSDVTVSIGVSTYIPEKKMDDYTLFEIQALSEFLIKKAENALKKSRMEGENRVAISEEFYNVEYDIDEEFEDNSQEEMDFDDME